MNFLNTVKAAAKTAKAWTSNHAPELLLAGGIVTFAGAIVAAAKAGSKTEEILEEHNIELRELKIEMATNKDIKESNVPIQYFRTAGKLAVEYAPAIGFTAVSLTCFCASYGILKKRYVALGAAYTALEESYRKYRERVIADKGEEADLYYLTGQKPETITVKNEDGEKEKHKVYTELPDGSIASPYAFKFGKYKENGERNLQWQNDRYLLMSYALGHQDYANDMLYQRSLKDDDGYILRRGSWMLNETRDLLGEDPTSIGAVAGNLFSNGEPGCNGYIDWRIIEATEIDPQTGNTIPCLWIDPNVDGLIYDKLEHFEEVPFLPNTTFDGKRNDIDNDI